MKQNLIDHQDSINCQDQFVVVVDVVSVSLSLSKNKSVPESRASLCMKTFIISPGHDTFDDPSTASSVKAVRG